MIGKTEKGGINMPDFVLQGNALKTVWLKNLFENKDHNFRWKFLPKLHLNQFGPNALVLKMSFEKECEMPEMKQLPLFYRQCITAWKMCNNKPSFDNTAEDIRQQLLWGNKNIRYKKKCLFWKHWVCSDILVIGDIVNKDGVIDILCIQAKLNKKGNYLCESKLIWSCIPEKWKNILRTEELDSNHSNVSYFHLRDHNPVLYIKQNTHLSV